MKLLRKIGFIFVFLLGIFGSNAQEFYNSIRPVTTRANSLNYKLSGQRYYFNSTLRGSPYLNEEWLLGTVILENGDRFDSLYLNLNTLTEQLIWYNNRVGSIINLDKFSIKEFILDSDKSSVSLFRKIYYGKYPKGDRYFNILHEGKIKLWAWYKTTVVSTTEYHDMLGYLRNTEYKSEPDFFVVLPDGNMVKTGNRRKSLINLFPEKKRVVRRLLIRNKIPLRQITTNEMAKAIQLIDKELFSN